MCLAGNLPDDENRVLCFYLKARDPFCTVDRGMGPKGRVGLVVRVLDKLLAWLSIY